MDVKRAKSGTVRSRAGLFGVCGRAAGRGRFAFDNAKEMPLASQLLALKYLKIVTVIFTKQPAARKSSYSYCTEPSGNLLRRNCRHHAETPTYLVIETARKERSHLKVGLNPPAVFQTRLVNLRNDGGSSPSASGFPGIRHVRVSRHHGITKHFSVTILNFIRHPCCVTTLRGL